MEYLPELTPATALRSLSLANVSAQADHASMRSKHGIRIACSATDGCVGCRRFADAGQAHAACLTHQVRILSDAAYSRFDVEVAAPTSTSYSAMVLGSGSQHKLGPLFALLFRRSTVQHPLLAGALGECSGGRGMPWD